LTRIHQSTLHKKCAKGMIVYFCWSCLSPDNLLKSQSGHLLKIETIIIFSTFDDYLDQRTIKNINEKLKIFKEIVLGLRYLHDQGVIHRDIKSSNLFLDSQNHVKIGDFGSGM
jgi:serine/threonine protein kinase